VLDRNVYQFLANQPEGKAIFVLMAFDRSSAWSSPINFSCCIW